MFNFISNILAEIALHTAIYSVGVASANGMHQPQEPESLKMYVNECKKSKKVTK